MTTNNPLQAKQLQTILAKFPLQKILVLGDLILDQYIWGSADRISPEAPVPIINVRRKEFRLGGAANVAANLASLQCQPILAGVCGSDSGETILRELAIQQHITPLILTCPDRPTTIKTRIIAHHQQVVRIDEEETSSISRKIIHDLIALIANYHGQFDGIIISDYAKGVVTEELISSILGLAGSRPVLVDPKGYHYRKYHGVTTIKPNFKEFCTAVRHPDLQLEELDHPARQMVKDLNLQGLVITLGEEGVYVLDNLGQSHRIPTQAREVFDVSGAGDTFIAAFCATLLSTHDWHISAEIANLAAGVAVGKIGTATVTPAELLASF